MSSEPLSAEKKRNQCDGCRRGLRKGKNGIHYDKNGKAVMCCTRHLYKCTCADFDGFVDCPVHI